MTGIRSFFNVENMVPASMRRGELPSNREAYRRMSAIALPSVLEAARARLLGQ